MGIITKIYQKNFLQRFDKDGAIPYYAAENFEGLFCEEKQFQNTAGVEIHYYLYHYENYESRKLILFLPGIGPGHTAYLAEIETLCKAGYRVLTLDYTGCGASGGELLPSVNAPARDALELLALLQPQEEIIPIGHSLGGYTALSIARLWQGVKRTVILSGFIGIGEEMTGFVKIPLLARGVERFEKKRYPQFGSAQNRDYLSSTQNNVLWIHSTDDAMVSFKHNAAKVKKLQNEHVRVIPIEGKKHNPQYTAQAVETMNAWIGEYTELVKENKLATLEARQAYFAEKPAEEMTRQDPRVWREILDFIEK